MNLPITLIFLSFRLTAFLDLFHKLNNIIALENKFKVANTNISPQNIVDTMEGYLLRFIIPQRNFTQ